MGMKEEYPPSIVVNQTYSTEGVETILTSSFDTDDRRRRTECCGIKHPNQVAPPSMIGITQNSSHDTTATTITVAATSLSQCTETMDVHECTSDVCRQCRVEEETSVGVEFTSVRPLDHRMIQKLRTQYSSKWYELGRSFHDLYIEANHPGRKRQGKSGSYDTSSTTRDYTTGSSRRALALVSSDGDETFY